MFRIDRHNDYPLLVPLSSAAQLGKYSLDRRNISQLTHHPCDYMWHNCRFKQWIVIVSINSEHLSSQIKNPILISYIHLVFVVPLLWMEEFQSCLIWKIRISHSSRIKQTLSGSKMLIDWRDKVCHKRKKTGVSGNSMWYLIQKTIVFYIDNGGAFESIWNQEENDKGCVLEYFNLRKSYQSSF